MAIYGHVHKQLLRYGSQGSRSSNPGLLACLFDWEPIQNHRAQYALIGIEEDAVTTQIPEELAYVTDELQDYQGQGPSEMYEELRRG